MASNDRRAAECIFIFRLTDTPTLNPYSSRSVALPLVLTLLFVVVIVPRFACSVYVVLFVYILFKIS